MAKYQLNEKPDYAVVPALELMPGQTGTISHVSIHEYCSNICRHTGGRISLSYVDDLICVVGFPTKLAEYGDAELEVLGKGCEYPLAELTELRNLERDFRKRTAKPPAVAAGSSH